MSRRGPTGCNDAVASGAGAIVATEAADAEAAAKGAADGAGEVDAAADAAGAVDLPASGDLAARAGWIATAIAKIEIKTARMRRP